MSLTVEYLHHFRQEYFQLCGAFAIARPGNRHAHIRDASWETYVSLFSHVLDLKVDVSKFPPACRTHTLLQSISLLGSRVVKPTLVTLRELKWPPELHRDII